VASQYVASDLELDDHRFSIHNPKPRLLAPKRRSCVRRDSLIAMARPCFLLGAGPILCVLLRWRANPNDDGTFRVIFADLRARTLTFAQLEELESSGR